MKTRARVGGVLWLIGVWVFAAAAVVVPVAVLSGCEYTERDPETGRELSAAQWAAKDDAARAAADADTKAALAEANRKAAALSAESAAAQEAARINAQKARRAFERAVARLQSETTLKVDDLAAEFDAAQADAALALRDTLAAFERRGEEIRAAAEDRAATNALAAEQSAARTKAALEAIEVKQARVMGGIKLAEGIAGSLGGPVGAGLAGLLGTAGIGGLIFGRAQSAKARNVAAEKDQLEETAKNVLMSLEALKLKNPAFKDMLKAEATLLTEWQGADGKALVNRLTA